MLTKANREKGEVNQVREIELEDKEQSMLSAIKSSRK
jgi:hypothetical protein